MIRGKEVQGGSRDSRKETWNLWLILNSCFPFPIPGDNISGWREGQFVTRSFDLLLSKCFLGNPTRYSEGIRNTMYPESNPSSLSLSLCFLPHPIFRKWNHQTHPCLHENWESFYNPSFPLFNKSYLCCLNSHHPWQFQLYSNTTHLFNSLILIGGFYYLHQVLL